MSRAGDYALALAPLASTPLWVWLLGEGRIDLGGGDKDLLLALPWAFGSGVFALSGGVLIARGWPLRRWPARALAVTLGALVGAFLVIYASSVLGGAMNGDTR